MSIEQINNIDFFLRDYTVYDDGRIFGHKKKKYLKANTINYGYQQVTLCRDKSRRSLLVHRVIAYVFLPKPPSKDHQINHKNLNKSDNSVSNLEWVTPSENMYHMYNNIGYKIKRTRKTISNGLH